MFTENLLCYVYNIFAGALTLWYFPDKRVLGIVISNQKIFVIAKVKKRSVPMVCHGLGGTSVYNRGSRGWLGLSS